MLSVNCAFSTCHLQLSSYYYFITVVHSYDDPGVSKALGSVVYPRTVERVSEIIMRIPWGGLESVPVGTES